MTRSFALREVAVQCSCRRTRKRKVADPRVDPLDQTVVTYMDTGEVIPCDLVVLKDAEGNVITVT